MDEKLTSKHTNVSGLSSKIAVHDVGATLDHSSQFKTEILFLSTPIEHATCADKEILRGRYKIRTVVNTVQPNTKRFVRDDKPSTAYISETFSIEDILGLNLCRIHLRYDAFAKNIINQLSPKAKSKFERDCDKAGVHDEKMKQVASDLVWNRDSIDDMFLVLVSSPPLIGRLFNEVLCKADMYPLIICGDRAMRDNTLIAFLLLLMLDVPFSAIENAYLQITEALPFQVGDEGDEAWAQRLKKAGWTENRMIWARELRRRLETKYGSVEAYFTNMGVTVATRNSIKDTLLASESKNPIVL